LLWHAGDARQGEGEYVYDLPKKALDKLKLKWHILVVAKMHNQIGK
jgi:hypothetical protein